MAEPTLIAVFGPNAVQDADSLTISKADLVNVGLTPSVNNSSEALLTAIIKMSETALTSANFDTNLDQSIVIEESFPDLPQRNGTTWRRNQKTISFYKPDLQSGIDPDDY